MPQRLSSGHEPINPAHKNVREGVVVAFIGLIVVVAGEVFASYDYLKTLFAIIGLVISAFGLLLVLVNWKHCSREAAQLEKE